ncbi:hypothetical protein pb186bvf_019009 [Paramecium bursaria]
MSLLGQTIYQSIIIFNIHKALYNCYFMQFMKICFTVFLLIQTNLPRFSADLYINIYQGGNLLLFEYR